MSIGVVDVDFFDLFRFELGIFREKFSPCSGCAGARGLTVALEAIWESVLTRRTATADHGSAR